MTEVEAMVGNGSLTVAAERALKTATGQHQGTAGDYFAATAGAFEIQAGHRSPRVSDKGVCRA